MNALSIGFSFAASLFCFCLFLKLKELKSSDWYQLVMVIFSSINLMFGVYNTLNFLEKLLS